MLVAVTVAPLASTAHASESSAATAPAGDVAHAKAQLAIGQQAYDEARHAEALVAFEAAYAAYPIADFQYNIGLCHERLGHVEAAIAAFDAYLEGTPGAHDRPTVERRIEVLRAQLPTVPVAETASGSRAPTAALGPPTAADLIDPFPSRSERSFDEPRESGRPLITGGAIAFALGVGIGVGGGLGFGLPAARRADDGGGRDTNRLLALQYASVGVGAVLVATGVGLLIVGKRKQRRAARHAWLAPTPWGLVIAGSF